MIRRLCLAMVTIAVPLASAGCSSVAEAPRGGNEIAAAMVAEMDTRAPEDQLPNWSFTRSLMLRPAPAVGDPAPDFELETFAGDEKIRLAEFGSSRPVVLVFGSWT